MVQKQGLEIPEEVLKEVYEYWRKRRLELKRPLLRQFWQKPSFSDANPFVSFRTREKEKIQTRRKRSSTLNHHRENMNRLREMRKDLVRTRAILFKLHDREAKKLTQLELEHCDFKQRVWDNEGREGACAEWTIFEKKGTLGEGRFKLPVMIAPDRRSDEPEEQHPVESESVSPEPPKKRKDTEDALKVKIDLSQMEEIKEQVVQ